MTKQEIYNRLLEIENRFEVADYGSEAVMLVYDLRADVGNDPSVRVDIQRKAV